MAVRKKKVGNEFLLIEALKELCVEKSIPEETLFDAIEAALIFACKKNSNADKNVLVDLDRDSGLFHVYEVRDVVADVNNPYKEISIYDAKAIDPRYELGDQVRREVPPEKLGRIAAQAAKQFVMQKIREAERGVVFDEFTNKDNDMVTGTVTRIEGSNLIVDIGKTEAILVPIEQLRSDNFKIGDSVRAYVAEVKKIGKGPQVYLSRTHPGLLKRLFELEVPEIQEGIITVKSATRDAGNRAKIAVYSNNENIDPVGSCLGEHGIRANAVSKELNGEKIDVVKWDPDPAIFIANSLSPSKVMRVSVNEGKKTARAVVPNNQLSLAIGKAGENARLSARLTGWKIDIKSKAQDKEEPLTEADNMRMVVLMEDKPRKPQKKKFDKNKKFDKSGGQAGGGKPFKKKFDKGDGQVADDNQQKKNFGDKPKKQSRASQIIAAPDFSGFDDVPDFDAMPDFDDNQAVAETAQVATPNTSDDSMPRFDEAPNFGESAFGDSAPNFNETADFDDGSAKDNSPNFDDAPNFDDSPNFDDAPDFGDFDDDSEGK